MPNFRRTPAQDDLEIVSRVMDTVAKQVSSYQMSLEKLRGLRKELLLDKALEKRIKSSPESMSKVLLERGIPEALAAGMVAEDFQKPDFATNLAMWTWDCCCTGCCLTCVCTANTSALEDGSGPVINPGGIARG